MNVQPERQLPLYAAVRARIMKRRDEFKIRHVEQCHVLYTDGLYVCPADTPEQAIARLNFDLTGVATCGAWRWVDPDDEYGDCFFVELAAYADPSVC